MCLVERAMRKFVDNDAVRYIAGNPRCVRQEKLQDQVAKNEITARVLYFFRRHRDSHVNEPEAKKKCAKGGGRQTRAVTAVTGP